MRQSKEKNTLLKGQLKEGEEKTELKLRDYQQKNCRLR